jgi:hypothetical protein
MKNYPRLYALLTLSLPFVTAHAAELEPGVLLKSGEWAQGVGSYGIPARFKKILPAKWPKDSWHSLRIADNFLQIQAQEAKDKNPDWLKKIVRQIPLENTASNSSSEQTAEQEYDSSMYLRVPGTSIKTGKLPMYVFKNGTSSLNPELDYAYRLNFNGQAFGLRVQNGLKGQNGAPYGEGAYYFIDYAGKKFEYALGYFGWTSRVVGISDIDGDGYPDFIIEIEGSNSGATFILLSSRAKPGKNRPTASLNFWGC